MYRFLCGCSAQDLECAYGAERALEGQRAGDVQADRSPMYARIAILMCAYGMHVQMHELCVATPIGSFVYREVHVGSNVLCRLSMYTEHATDCFWSLDCIFTLIALRPIMQI